MSTTWVYLFFVLALFQLDFTGSDDLLMLFILSRHGDRTPIHTFPKDPFNKLWEMRLGYLTYYGAEQHFALGSLIRDMYPGFISSTYKQNEVFFRSSRTERTLSSAKNFIRGLYNVRDTSYLELPHVYSKPLDEDHLLKMSSPCPTYASLLNDLMKSDFVLGHSKKYAVLFNALEAVSGVKFPSDRSSTKNFKLAWKICDSINTWFLHQLNDIPAEITPQMHKQCLELVDFRYHITYSRPSLTYLRGGPLIGHIIQLVNQRITHLETNSNQWSPRMFAYFAHDSTLSAALHHLGVFNGHQPPLASSLLIELFRSTSTTSDFYYLSFRYRNQTNTGDKYFWNIWPPICGEQNPLNKCPLAQFARSINDTYARDVNLECQLKLIRAFDDNDDVDDAHNLDIDNDSYHYHYWLFMLILCFQLFVVLYWLSRSNLLQYYRLT